MPAIFVHFIHGYLIYGLKGGIFGMLPDLLSFGRVGIARIYEVDPNRQVACFISEGKRIQWNGSFWDTFILKEDGLYI